MLPSARKPRKNAHSISGEGSAPSKAMIQKPRDKFVNFYYLSTKLHFRTKNVYYLIVFLADLFNNTSLQRQYVTSRLPSGTPRSLEHWGDYSPGYFQERLFSSSVRLAPILLSGNRRSKTQSTKQKESRQTKADSASERPSWSGN